ncbi:tbc1 domain family member 13 [Stylonychia lemnae]|uniref:Tbc1 domain family member 13 n=1 Tax=Stylonychia lemnae TaxID=5949 RepID=A0A078A9B4_STYLE|nr:tbc1 domain family member 13 [Stylonychia lemnae]|eukprot:CDW78172.1 tbc1 domain family member 13 [Stylonychia lemnae]
MESYFGFNSSSLKEKFKSKLAQATKLIPKDIVNKAQNVLNQRKRNQSFTSPETLDEDQNDGETIVIDINIQNQNKKKSNEFNCDESISMKKDHYFKKNQNDNSQESPDSKSSNNLDDKFEVIAQHRQSLKSQQPVLELPDPTKACNDIIKNLMSFNIKNLEQQSSYRIKEQAINIINLINQPKINVVALQDLCFNSGIPDEIKGLRPLAWRILLNHYPPDTKSWEQHIIDQKEVYDGWKRDLIIKPTIKQEEEYKQAKRMMDHPLSLSSDSKWKQFYQDQEIWDEIEKDVKRTRTDLSFFYQAVDNNKNVNNMDLLMKQAECKRSELTLEQKEKFIETHADVLLRVLFIYAKLNPGIRYVQGMNEVLAVIYYCFWRQGDELIISNQYLESDLFFCFNNLMSEIRDGFLRELDREQSGITGKVQTYANILKEVDPLVYRNLQEQNVNHQFYALRWQMLLMCQEFDMSNVLVLWDALFSDSERFSFLNYVCCATVNLKRKIVLVGDFAECMENLQRACDHLTDVSDLINDAKKIQEKHFKLKIKERIKYENMMSLDDDI